MKTFPRQVSSAEALIFARLMLLFGRSEEEMALPDSGKPGVGLAAVVDATLIGVSFAGTSWWSAEPKAKAGDTFNLALWVECSIWAGISGNSHPSLDLNKS